MSRSKRNAAAEDYFKRAPNYSAEAIVDLLAFSVSAERKYPMAAYLATLFAQLTEEAHKFALPVGGRLFDTGIDASMIEAFRLPFEVSVFEFDAIPDSAEQPRDRFNINPIRKRVALCFDASLLKLTEKFHDGSPACVIWPIDFLNGRWSPSWVGALVPYEQSATFATKEDLAAARHTLESLGADMRHRWADKTQYRCGFLPLGELGREVFAKLSDEESLLSAQIDTGQEVVAVVQSCAAMACTNVTTDVIRPNREARAARPASTLFDYHVLMIRPGAEHTTSEDKGGTHASPRTHLRRGHIRRLAWGPRIWVNSCVVNPSAIGTVNKDYRVVA